MLFRKSEASTSFCLDETSVCVSPSLQPAHKSGAQPEAQVHGYLLFSARTLLLKNYIYIYIYTKFFLFALPQDLDRFSDTKKCTSLATRKMQQHSAGEHKPSHTRRCSSSVHSEGLVETALAAATPFQGRRLWWWDFSFRPDHQPTSRHYGPATARYPLARTLTKSRLGAAPLSTQRHRPACILFARQWQHASLGGTTNS